MFNISILTLKNILHLIIVTTLLIRIMVGVGGTGMLINQQQEIIKEIDKRFGFTRV
jgi:hypothetical protein